MRILGSLGLLFISPFSIPFLLIYAACGISDVLDGYIARKNGTANKMGALLDSISDFIFIACLLIIFLPAITFPLWSVYWIAFIGIVRLISLIAGFIRYGRLAFLHTYANKASGAALFFFPVIYFISDINTAVIFVCSIASISALEELLINFTSEILDRDIRSIFLKSKY